MAFQSGAVLLTAKEVSAPFTTAFAPFVTVKGDINPETGFLVNLKDLSRIVNEKIISKIDHKNINLEVDFMKDKLASTENLAKAIFEELENAILQLGANLHSIKLYETENNFVEYFGIKH